MRSKLGIALIMLVWAWSAFAADLPWQEQLKKDLEPVTGLVVMADGKELLLDLTTARGVRVGDLCAVLAPGEPVTHPVTGEVLGKLDKLRGVVRITRIEANFSFATPLHGEGFQRGDAVERFSRIPADASDAGALAPELTTLLPQLSWDGEASLLHFAQRDGVLLVTDERGQQLYSYPLPSSKTTGAVVAAPATGIVAAAPVQPQAEGGIVHQQSEQEAGIWKSRPLKVQPVALAVADFDGEGEQEIAMLTRDRLTIYRFRTEGLETLAQADLVNGSRGISLDTMDLDGDQHAELYVTALDNLEQLASQAYLLKDGALARIANNKPYYFRAVTLVDGTRVLAGQKMGDARHDFDGPVFRIELDDATLHEGESFPWHDDLHIFGTQPFSQTPELFARLSPERDALQVIGNDGERLWESQEPYGGRLFTIMRPDPDTQGRDQRCYYLPARMERGTAGEILVPQNDGSRLSGCYRKYKSSRLAAMTWDGYALVESWHTREQKGTLADFALGDVDGDGKNEIVQAVIFSGGLFGQDRSSVLVFELE